MIEFYENYKVALGNKMYPISCHTMSKLIRDATSPAS